ncbi:uncharacterized protein LOC120117176 [Hibiscus syriacus]|uniref:uncharacterized protein LOC120117176 n=1 Tax=Hibiscus syriacus TaxID=106335 RepID=UPI001924E467|nr:uncharacterized protein LOC120117176 [Hibiscus syriacus]
MQRRGSFDHGQALSNPSSSSPPPPPREQAWEDKDNYYEQRKPNPSYDLAAEEKQHCLVASESPNCRPWDRGDFLRRLSTFKSMTWFAKPKVASALLIVPR